MTGADVFPRPLGPYLLLGRVGRGGMGDVYLAKHGLLLGFEKHCVLKMLRDDRANDHQLLARFSDEARVVVQLSHRNICPVFDVGRVGTRLYVALEYVVGRDLKTVAATAPVPIAIAIHVVGEVLEALDYAHRFVDVRTGAPLGIVHRDVSPHNVLLGVEGDTKLIDFGIATTSGHLVREEESVLGKISYMSPEHARGDVVDGRSDQFAAALMLTELLLGERFHDGLSQHQIWENAGQGSHRPARFATIDVELRAILDQALAPQPADRYPSCADLGDALSRWARAHSEVASPRDVRRHLSVVFGDLGVEHRQLLRSVDVVVGAFAHQSSPPQPVQGPGAADVDDEGQFESIATTLASPSHTPAFGSIATTAIVDRRRPPQQLPPPTATEAAPAGAATPWRMLGLGLSLGIVAAGLLTWLAVSPSPRTPKQLVEVVTDLPPLSAVIDAGVASAVNNDAGVVVTSPPPPSPPSPPSPPPRLSPPSTRPPLPPRPANRPPTVTLDAETSAAVSALKDCVDKVPCAKGIIEWSRQSTLKETERDQLRESATDCAKRCRLK